MIKHIVWWTLKDEAEGHSALENAATIKAMAEALMGQVENMHSIEVSYDFKQGTTVEASVILQSVHTDEAALKTYAEHPEHVKLGQFIKNVVTGRSAIDYEI